MDRVTHLYCLHDEEVHLALRNEDIHKKWLKKAIAHFQMSMAYKIRLAVTKELVYSKKLGMDYTYYWAQKIVVIYKEENLPIELVKFLVESTNGKTGDDGICPALQIKKLKSGKTKITICMHDG